MKLTEARRRELRILSYLSEKSADFGYCGFRSISLQTQIKQRQVRVDVRRMARKGLTEYGKGLWTEDGEPAGSGYCITDLGRAALAQSVEKM